jgi:hypothetical protein
MQNYGPRNRMARLVLEKIQNDENLSRIDRNQVHLNIKLFNYFIYRIIKFILVVYSSKFRNSTMPFK